MIIEIKIPSPGESITEADLVRWLVSDGEMVKKDQEIGEIESEKASLPIIASHNGKVQLKAQVGSTLPVGFVICTIDTAAYKSTITKPAGTQGRQAETVPDKTEENLTQITNGDSAKKTIRITPLARKMMEYNQVSEGDINSGLKKISKNEVETVIKNKHATGNGASLRRYLARSRMSALRRKVSQRLVAVKNETAMLTTFNEADMSQIQEIRREYGNTFREKYGVKLGYMSFFTRAAAIALKEFPQVNSMIDDEDILQPSFIDIAIAVQSEKGLMVPVIRNADFYQIPQLEQMIQDLASKVRNNTIRLEEMSGGTFSITNGGVFGSMLSTPILNPPQSAILGMHQIIDRPVAIGGKVEIRPMMYLALTYDHRIIDGKDSVQFLIRIKELIEDPLGKSGKEGISEDIFF